MPKRWRKSMASTRSSAPPSAVDRRPDGVDGAPFREIVEPFAPAETARLLRSAAEDGVAVTPFGGGTKLALGNIPDRVEFGMSLAKLDRVLHYEPTDMTLSVEAGARFRDVAAVLAERGQALPLDLPDDDRATIGGLIATAVAGPRRLGSGTLRDLLIGIAVAYPDGTLGKAGGLVVKNVTGFDLMRLHHGALGTLGVVVSANFKVLPIARAESTLISKPLPLDGALEHAAAARSGRVRPIAVEVFAEGDAWITAARIEGRPQPVRSAVATAQAVGTWSRALETDESRAWWRAFVQRQTLLGDDVVVRCGVEPKRHRRLVDDLKQTLARLGISANFVSVSPGLGTVVVRFPWPETPGGLAAVAKSLAPIGDTFTILRAPAGAKRDVDVWGKAPDAIDFMRALKAEYDPARVLNPGRFVGRI